MLVKLSHDTDAPPRGEDIAYEDGQANEGLVHDPHAKKELAEETTELDTTPTERLPLVRTTDSNQSLMLGIVHAICDWI